MVEHEKGVGAAAAGKRSKFEMAGVQKPLSLLKEISILRSLPTSKDTSKKYSLPQPQSRTGFVMLEVTPLTVRRKARRFEHSGSV